MSARAVLLLAALFFASCGGKERAEEVPAYAFEEDARLVELLERCPTRGHFDGDTTDLLPVQVRKLSDGQLEVIRHFREELAEAGEAAVPALEALVRRSYSEPHGGPALRNALGVLRLSRAPSAHTALRLCLEHPAEEVRAAAAAGLVAHARPQDYEPLGALLGISAPDTRQTLVAAMSQADPDRLARDLVVWMEEGRGQDLWLPAARAAARGASDAARAELRPALELAPGPAVRAALLAGLVLAGEQGALSDLRSLLGSAQREERSAGLEGMELCERPAEALALLADAEVELRFRAAGLLQLAAAEERVRDGLRGALRDAHERVRDRALESLLAVGDAAAQDLALELLGGSPPEIGRAQLALRAHWVANRELAPRAFALLRERCAQLADRPLEERTKLLAALGELPDAAAARFLLDEARAAGSRSLGKLSGHRWIARQLSSSAEGRALAREAWSGEADEERRLDLIEAAAAGLDAPTREFLLAVVQSERAGPYETLYAAELLARLGPASSVAPVLKRVALRNAHPRVRPALDCLMWRWYG